MFLNINRKSSGEFHWWGSQLDCCQKEKSHPFLSKCGSHCLNHADEHVLYSPSTAWPGHGIGKLSNCLSSFAMRLFFFLFAQPTCVSKAVPVQLYMLQRNSVTNPDLSAVLAVYHFFSFCSLFLPTGSPTVCGMHFIWYAHSCAFQECAIYKDL